MFPILMVSLQAFTTFKAAQPEKAKTVLHMPIGEMRRCESGFSYVLLLIGVAVLSAGTAALSELWAIQAERERMFQLQWIGEEYVRAIGSYYHATPTTQKHFPQRIDDLLEDQRLLVTRRHLRRAYPNPLTGQMDWELMRDHEGGIRGIRVQVRAKRGNERTDFQYLPSQ